MAQDPAALFYIDHWLAATREMRADCRGWYVNLVLHQFKSGDLPNNIEELANLAGVRISEYDMFQQVWQQVLKQKFEVLATNRLKDFDAAEIIRKRETFKKKRAAAGKMSAVIKFIRRHLCQDENVLQFIKETLDPDTITTFDQQVLKQVFKQMFQLYINRDKNTNRIDEDIGGVGEEEEEREGWILMPGPAEQALELPAVKAGCAKELMHLNGNEASDEQVSRLWEVFKIQNFTGSKFYSSRNETYTHFINWSKSQKVNGKVHQPRGANGKSAGAAQLVQQLGADLATGGKPDSSG